MKKYPWLLIYWDEEMRGGELSCEEFLLCASMKEIRYDKLVSMDGKYKHIQKKKKWLEMFPRSSINLFHSYFEKALFLFN